jgi:hypothetical protein
MHARCQTLGVMLPFFCIHVIVSSIKIEMVYTKSHLNFHVLNASISPSLVVHSDYCDVQCKRGTKLGNLDCDGCHYKLKDLRRLFDCVPLDVCRWQE